MRCRDIVVVVVVAGMDYDILTSVSMIMVIFSASGGRWKAASTLRRRPAECHPTVIIQGLARRRLYHTGLHRTRKKGTPPPPPPPRSPTDTIPTLAQFNRLSNTGGRKGGKRERGRGATEPRDDDRSIVFSPRLHAAPEREGGGEKVADIYHSRDTSQLEPGVILY